MEGRLVTEPEQTEGRQVERDAPDINIGATAIDTHGATRAELASKGNVFELSDVTVSYAGKPAVSGVTMEVASNAITAFIGPSGCGKSTLIRCLNRMNDLIPSASVDGQVLYHGEDIYADQIDPVEVRKRIGMVFQKPNPFPKSIYDNIAFGPRILGDQGRHGRDGRERAPRARRCGTRSRTGSTRTRSGCPAASSSASASPAASPSTPT